MTRPVPIEPPMAICEEEEEEEEISEALSQARANGTHHGDLASLQATVQVLVLGDTLVNLAVVGGCRTGRLALVHAAAAVEALLRVDLLVEHGACSSSMACSSSRMGCSSLAESEARVRRRTRARAGERGRPASPSPTRRNQGSLLVRCS